MSIKVVSFKICPFVQRVTAVLELKGVDYDVEYISLAEKPAWFLEASPHGEVPILLTDEGVLFESDPICEYIDDIFDEHKLHPMDPFKRAQNRAWIALATRNYLVQCRSQRSPTAEMFSENQNELSQVFAKIEAVLGDGPFFNGEQISQVDAAWFVVLHRSSLICQGSGYDFLADFPKLLNWRCTLLGVNALNCSVPEGFVDEFNHFYLNESTYLGNLMKSRAGSCGNHAEACCNPETLRLCCH